MRIPAEVHGNQDTVVLLACLPRGWARTSTEVRPRAGAHIWSNCTAVNPNPGPGELVVHTLEAMFLNPDDRLRIGLFPFHGRQGLRKCQRGGGETDGSVQ